MRVRGGRPGASLKRIAHARGWKVAGASIATGALVAAMGAGGAQTAVANDSNPLSDLMPSAGPSVNPSQLPNMINQDPKGETTSKLNVTVGKSVLINTSPVGKPGLTVLATSTQVSGSGKATVKVPMGTTSPSNGSGFGKPKVEGESIVYDLENRGSNVQTFAASNSSYKGKLPLKVEVTATLDGKKIHPADMVKVSGHVQLNYTITNETAQDTKISFKGPGGGIVTETQKIPVPFGAAFSITLPKTFADINAEWAQGGISPSGTQLSGTLYLIPPLGALSQTLSIQARADQASLPPSTLQALPVALSNNSMGRIAFKYAPLVNTLAQDAVQYGNLAATDVAKYKALFLQYAAKAEGINNKYVKPAIQAFGDGEAALQVSKLTTGFTSLADGTEQLSKLLPSAQEVIGFVNLAVGDIVPLIEANEGTINSALAKVQAASTLVNQLEPTIETYANLVETMGPTYLANAQELVQDAITYCPIVKRKFDAIVPYLTPLVIGAVRVLSPELANGLQLVKDDAPLVDEYLGDCIADAPLIAAWLQTISAMMPTILADIETAEGYLTTLVAYLNKGAGYAQLIEANETQFNKMMDNNNCVQSPSDIGNCGMMQQISFLNKMMVVAVDSVSSRMVPGTAQLASYVPTINKYFKLATKYVGEYGPKLERALPETIKKVEDGFGIAGNIADEVVKYAAQGETIVARTTAELQIMNARAEAGQGMPAGPAEGANTTLGVYEYQLAGADNAGKQNVILLGVAGLLLLLSAGVGTAMYVRRK